MATDSKRIKACLTACSELYSKEISGPVTDLWWMALKGYDIEAVERAFQKHLTNPDTGQFMPKPADIIRMLAGTTTDAAMVAWAKVERAVRLVGPWASITFDDPIIHCVLQDMGGWIGLNGKKSDEWPFVGNEFRTRYKGASIRDGLVHLPRLIGVHETSNPGIGALATAGFLTYFGDFQACKRVEASAGAPPPQIHRIGEAAAQLALGHKA